MSEPEVKPEKKEPPPKPGMSLRSVATITGAVVGMAGLVTLLAFGGWLAVAGGTVAVAGAGYTRHRMKNPRRPSGRRTSNGRKLSWPLTGSQSRRALLPRGTSGKSTAGGKAGRTGFPKLASASRSRTPGRTRAGSRGIPLPKTTRSRARAGAGGALPKHVSKRSVPSPTRPVSKSSVGAGKPKGIRLPKTPSRTPAKPGSASRLMGGRSSTRRKRGSSSSTRRAARSPARGKGSSLLPKRSGSTAKRSIPGRSSTSPTRRRILGLSKSPSRNGRGGGKATGRRSLNPLKRTSPSGKHSRLRNPLKRTTGIRGPRPGRTKTPNRSARRPKIFRRAKARTLFRLGLGLPVRKGRKLVRPTPAQRRRAWRTIRLRGITRVLWLRKIPGLYSRWHWDRIQVKIPQKPDPAWRQTTIPLPTPKAVAGPRHAVLVSSPSTEAPKMSDPHGVIAEAFNHLAQFQPQSASEMERYLAMQHELFTNIGMAYSTLADRMQSEMPFGASSADSTRDLGAAFSGLSQLAQEVHATFRQEHEAELQRIEQPRPGEEIWNTDRQ